MTDSWLLNLLGKHKQRLLRGLHQRAETENVASISASIAVASHAQHRQTVNLTLCVSETKTDRLWGTWRKQIGVQPHLNANILNEDFLKEAGIPKGDGKITVYAQATEGYFDLLGTQISDNGVHTWVPSKPARMLRDEQESERH